MICLSFLLNIQKYLGSSTIFFSLGIQLYLTSNKAYNMHFNFILTAQPICYRFLLHMYQLISFIYQKKPKMKTISNKK